MFVVIYKFQVKKRFVSRFIRSWTGLTKLIYARHGSLGSRLHKGPGSEYIAYAQWPAKSDWRRSRESPAPDPEGFRKELNDVCEHIEVLHELELVADLLEMSESGE